MSLSKKSVADLAQEIRQAKVTAAAHSDEARFSYACFVGALESVIAHFIQQQKQDSTEVRAAFDYTPTDDEVLAHKQKHAQWRADYAARSAAAGSHATTEVRP